MAAIQLATVTSTASYGMKNVHLWPNRQQTNYQIKHDADPERIVASMNQNSERWYSSLPYGHQSGVDKNTWDII